MPAIPSSPASRVSRVKERIYAPARRDVPIPGAGSVFGRGFARLVRKRKGARTLLAVMAVALPIFLLGLLGSVGPFKEGLRESAPPWLFLAALGLGAAFFLIPLRLFHADLDSLARGDRKGDKSQPWTWEYPWSTEYMKPDYRSGSAARRIVGRVALVAVIGLFNFGWSTDSLFFKGLLIVLDLFALVVVYDSLRKLIQWLRFRHSVVIWSAAPVFTGQRLEGRIAFAHTLRPAGPLRATLRCVVDEWVNVPEEPPHRQLLPFAIYQETHETAVPESGRLDALDLSFEIPRNLPGSDLASEEATYWQVVMVVPMAGPDLEEVFLAPIYQKGRRK